MDGPESRGQTACHHSSSLHPALLHPRSLRPFSRGPNPSQSQCQSPLFTPNKLVLVENNVKEEKTIQFMYSVELAERSFCIGSLDYRCCKCSQSFGSAKNLPPYSSMTRQRSSML